MNTHTQHLGKNKYVQYTHAAHIVESKREKKTEEHKNKKNEVKTKVIKRPIALKPINLSLLP